MEKITNLKAIVERPDGTTFEQTIATKKGETTFTASEIRNAISKYSKILGKEYLICDTYEEIAKVWF